ncbi:MAG: flagellar biosynthesis protein FliQ [Candidatus Berkiella sp.]
MGPESVIDLFRQALLIIILLVSIIVIPSLVTGLIVSIFQAATQINEQSLSFIPRLLVTFLTLILAAPWLSSIITDFTHSVFDIIPQLIG